MTGSPRTRQASPRPRTASDNCQNASGRVFSLATQSDGKIIIVGDLNDDPVDESLMKHLKARPKPQDMKKEDATFNLVGEKTIKTAIEAGIISGENIGRIDGIPFALVLL